MMIAIVALSVLAVLLAVAIFCYEREFRRVARFLAERREGSNERMTVELRTRGTLGAVHEVNGLMDDVRQAQAEAGEERRRFREGIASLSHDVRTPLAGAQGYLQLYGIEDDAAEQRRCVREAAERLADMKELIDQLFEYTKVRDPGRTSSIEEVSVYDAAVDAFFALYPEFSERGWEPSIDFADERLSVQANREDVVRIFTNLATNCLRHGVSAPVISQLGRRVSVSNRVAEPAAIDVDRLFTRFYRADTSRSAAGSGLGLAIVASLCEGMGATASASLENGVLAIGIDF